MKPAEPIRVVLPGVVPTERAIGGLWSRANVRAAIRPWHEALTEALQGEQLPPRVSATVTLGFTDRRKRTVAAREPIVRRLLIDALGQEPVELTIRLSRRKQAATTVVLAAGPGPASRETAQ